jgi:hypothetical protein
MWADHLLWLYNFSNFSPCLSLRDYSELYLGTAVAEFLDTRMCSIQACHRIGRNFHIHG